MLNAINGSQSQQPFRAAPSGNFCANLFSFLFSSRTNASVSRQSSSILAAASETRAPAAQIEANDKKEGEGSASGTTTADPVQAATDETANNAGTAAAPAEPSMDQVYSSVRVNQGEPANNVDAGSGRSSRASTISFKSTEGDATKADEQSLTINTSGAHTPEAQTSPDGAVVAFTPTSAEFSPTRQQEDADKNEALQALGELVRASAEMQPAPSSLIIEPSRPQILGKPMVVLPSRAEKRPALVNVFGDDPESPKARLTLPTDEDRLAAPVAMNVPKEKATLEEVDLSKTILAQQYEAASSSTQASPAEPTVHTAEVIAKAPEQVRRTAETIIELAQDVKLNGRKDGSTGNENDLEVTLRTKKSYNLDGFSNLGKMEWKTSQNNVYQKDNTFIVERNDAFYVEIKDLQQ